MYQKLPYYMAYPIQTEYDERAERTDLEYMKSLYPDLQDPQSFYFHQDGLV